MMKLQHTMRRLSLPLLLGAAALPLGAAPTKTPLVYDAPASLLAKASSRRAQAVMLASREKWPEAASQWRLVLLELRRSERLLPPGEPESQSIEPMRREAEREFRRAQSHLGSFWKVRDLVTPGVDSNNLTPAMAASKLGAQKSNPVIALSHSAPVASKVLASAAISAPLGRRSVSASGATSGAPTDIFAAARQVLKRAPSQATSRSVRAHEVFVQGLMLDDLGRRESRGAKASLRWAKTQWWTGPMVQRAADSRNPLLLNSLASKPAPILVRTPMSSNDIYRSVAVLVPSRNLQPRVPTVPALPAPLETSEILRRQIENWATVPSSAVDASRIWTMQIRLPSAAEAALAVHSLRRANP